MRAGWCVLGWRRLRLTILVLIVLFLATVFDFYRHRRQQHPISKEQLEPQTNSGSSKFGSSKNSPFFSPVAFQQYPETSVFCSGDRENRFGSKLKDRICKFKYLYYYPNKDRFVFLKSDQSTFFNAGPNRNSVFDITQAKAKPKAKNDESKEKEDGFIDLTSLSEHNAFFFDYVDASPSFFEQFPSVNFVPKLTFMFSRFHVGNIMHTLHDDIIGLYFMMKMYSPNEPYSRPFTDPRKEKFGKDVNILLADGWKEGDYGHLFKLFSKNPLLFKDNIAEDKDAVYCFNEIVVGNSKQANWYQYGFSTPQGPIKNKIVSGFQVREVANYVMSRLGISTWESVDPIVSKMKQRIQSKEFSAPIISDNHFISIFSRKGDRLILNEEELAQTLSERYGLATKFIRNEDLDFASQVEILRKTVVAIGMHGSLLIMGMFMPQNSIMVELFPYGVPPEHYTPYRTMCQLPGVDIRYSAWSNRHPDNNVAHPDRPAHLGGINHLPDKEREEIEASPLVPEHLCCSNPYWLYRIYQDTKTDKDELSRIIDGNIRRQSPSKGKSPFGAPIKPSPVSNEKCIAGRQGDKPALKITWDTPWNGVKPLKYGLWVHQDYKEYFSDSNTTVFHCQPGTTYEFWVRSYYNSDGIAAKSEYGQKFTCLCE